MLIIPTLLALSCVFLILFGIYKCIEYVYTYVILQPARTVLFLVAGLALLIVGVYLYATYLELDEFLHDR